MRGAPVDRISDLPGDILDNILKYLPVHDAVRTSILSKKWRYQWVTMPNLVFDENFRELIHKYSLKKKIYGNAFLTEAITSHILSLHKGPVTKFLVKDKHHYADYYPWHCLQWLFILSDCHLKDLALSSSYNVMPPRLFDFKQLKHLYMEGFEISDLPPTFEGFTNLVKLDLLRFRNTNGKLRKFLSKCPVLEYLNLQKVDILSDFMEELPNLDRLTVLRLGEVWLGKARCLFSLIKNSPLRCLDISLRRHYDKDPALEYLNAQHKVHVHFSHLEDVKIKGKLCTRVEREFIKILLLRAVALRTLKIEKSVFEMEKSSGMMMLRIFHEAPRASKSLKIIFV